MKIERNKSAKAKLTKYLLFVNRIEPRDPNITTRAAKFPSNENIKIINERKLIIQSLDGILVVVNIVDVNNDVKFTLKDFRHVFI